MSGKWLEDGTHFNIKDDAAKEIAKEMREKGSATFLGEEVRMVLPTQPGQPQKVENRSIKLPKPLGRGSMLHIE